MCLYMLDWDCPVMQQGDERTSNGSKETTVGSRMGIGWATRERDR